jgi:DNA-binding NarL/FixJ family response regulator
MPLATAGSAAAKMAEPLGDPTARDAASHSLRIVIGENNADLAITLGLLLDAEPDMRCVATGASASEVLSSLEQHAPNTFILDLSLDDGPSLPLIATLRERLPSAVIVVFTGHKNELLTEHCLRAGADALVVKSGDFDELTGALRRAALASWGSGAAGPDPAAAGVSADG